jgi:uncharacterized protein
MKLHADPHDATSITAYGEGWIAVNGVRHPHSLVLATNERPRPWGVARFEDLQAGHFEALFAGAATPPELLVLGSGKRLRFVAPALMRCLIERRIGVETMDTPAACRTYNILAAEGRKVMAALLVEP